MDSVHSNVRGQSLSAHFYRRIQAVILVCSLDNEHSLHRLTHWIHEAQVYIKVNFIISCMYVLNFEVAIFFYNLFFFHKCFRIQNQFL